MKKIFLIAAAFLMAAPGNAKAHYLWFETPEGAGETAEVRVYYGEYEEGAREEAGARLDEVTPVEVRVLDGRGQGPQALEKQQDHFSFSVARPEAPVWLQLTETARPVQDWAKYDIGVVKPEYYGSAILGDVANGELPAVPEEKTMLAVYPLSLGEAPVFQVFFRGEPLAKAKVLVHAPNEWTKEWRTNENGEAQVRFPWPGLYVVEVIHKEPAAGEFEGTAYEAVRHRATFSTVRGQ